MVTYVNIGICEPDVLTAGHVATLGRDDSPWINADRWEVDELICFRD